LVIFVIVVEQLPIIIFLKYYTTSENDKSRYYPIFPTSSRDSSSLSHHILSALDARSTSSNCRIDVL